jgi:hypothetical protein
MKDIVDLLLRVWQRSQPASNTQVEFMAENRDQSSMADFVRILQAYVKTGTAGVRVDHVISAF